MKRFLKLAIDQAEKSSLAFRHGAVLISRHRAIGTGYNHARVFLTHRYQMPSTHAEMDAIRRVLCPAKVDGT